jgi:hypothetical protein
MRFQHKVIVTGTRRPGTTRLVYLLTELGLDTGIIKGAALDRTHGYTGLRTNRRRGAYDLL